MAQPSVLFAGDSHTRGTLGAQWTDACTAAVHAAQQPRGICAGVNGEMSNALARRLPPLLSRHKPDAVVLLVGTNDVLAASSKQWARWHRHIMWQLDAGVVSPADHQAHYLNSMRALLDTTTKHFSAAQSHRSSPAIIVVTIPPITEDLSSPLNDLVRSYNLQLQLLVSQHNSAHPSSVALVDFYAACHEAIAAAECMKEPQQPQCVQQAPGPLSVSKASTLGLLQRWLRWKSWDAISQERGHACLLMVFISMRGALVCWRKAWLPSLHLCFMALREEIRRLLVWGMVQALTESRKEAL